MEHPLRPLASEIVSLEEKMMSVLRALDQKTSHLLVQGTETERRLEEIERKTQEFLHFRDKFLDWLGQYSRKLEDVRGHRDEARVSFESVYCKLEDLDQDVRLIKAAVRDVDRRYEGLQKRATAATTPGGQGPGQTQGQGKTAPQAIEAQTSTK